MKYLSYLGLVFGAEKSIMLRYVLLPFIVACLLLTTLPVYAKQGSLPREIVQQLEKDKSQAQKGHQKVNQKLADTISKIHAQLSKMPPDKVRRPLDLSVHSTPLVRVNAHGDIHVYIYVNSWGGAEQSELEKHGVKVEIANEEFGIVQAWVPYNNIETTADLDFITRITVPVYAEIQSGSVLTEGDSILNADDVRALGYIGSGIKVGVISDGVIGLPIAQQSGDLPSITVLVPGNGAEGTAILEIIHDLAPGASLGFCGLAVGTSLEFSQCVTSLGNSFSADIVIDDVFFPGEPYFEDGLVAQTVEGSINQGVFHSSSAGNFAGRHYQEEYLADPSGDDLHDFGRRSGFVSDIDVDFSIPPMRTLIVWLQWSEPYAGACSDYDLYLLDAQFNVLDASLIIQNCDDDPIEAVGYMNPFPYAVPASVVINKYSGSSRELEMFYTLDPLEYKIPEGSVVGHAAVPGVMATAAIDASDPGNNNIEPFSSHGPSEILFPAPEIRFKPDIAAIDGVSVTGAGGFPTPFFGTSAAAPHAAGVAALLMSASPSASATQISQGITSSAVDLGSPGGDYVYGYGRIDAFSALNTISPLGSVDLSGTIKTTGGLDICAMVLASGQFMFSCNPWGVFSLNDLPRETDGTVKRQIYADGFFPMIDTLTGSSVNEAIVMVGASNCPSYNSPYSPGVYPGSAGTWIDISGNVLVQNTQTPICAMVLANGQHMFSCDGTGSYNLHIPLDENGQFKLQVYADGFAPTIQFFDEFSTSNTVKMAYAV